MADQPLKYGRIAALHADTDGQTLRLTMNESDAPPKVVWIKSREAWQAYGRGIPVKPMVVFKPPIFKMIFEDGVTKTWTAELATLADGGTDEVMLHNLVLQSDN